MIWPQIPHIWLSILKAPNRLWVTTSPHTHYRCRSKRGRAGQHHRNNEYIQDNALRRRSGL